MQKFIQLGPFELSEVIGRGGMGEVWAGAHAESQVGVAVKVVTGQGAQHEEYLRLFRNEIRAVAALNHPGIVLVFDMGAVDLRAEEQSGGRLRAGSPYLVMELSSRGSLDGYVEFANWPIVRHTLFRVLDGLSHAHARGMVHRDLKPQNLLVGCAGSDPLGLKIADFGLAHPLDLTGRTGRFERGWGTPYYMAPEQFRGRFRDYGPCTDLYALGVIAWEMTTGELPFNSEDVVELSSLHLHAELPAYRPNMEVPHGFEGWVRRLLRKDIGERFPSAAHADWSLRRLLGIDKEREVRDDRAEMDAQMSSTSGQEFFRVGQAGTRDLPGGDFQDASTIHAMASTTMLIDPDATDILEGGLSGIGGRETQAILSFAGFPSLANPGVSAPNDALASIVSPPVPADWRRPTRNAPMPQLLGAGLGLFGLRTVPMVDRQEERDWLWAQLREVHRDHQPRLVVLRGSTGTGKSRLARWLCERASEVGAATILSATHGEIEAPHDGLAPIFARHFGCVGLERGDIERRLERLLQADGVHEPYEWRALTELFSPLRDDVAGRRVGTAAEKGYAHHVRLSSNAQRYALLRRAIERMARVQPVVVWLDDVQWGADALSWAQFLLAGADPTRTPVLIIATAHEDMLAERPVERALLEELSAASCARTRLIEPLRAEDTAELVRRLLMLEGALAEEVEERCAGNPLFAVQLVGDWVAGGKLRVGERGFCLETGESASIPDEIHQIWRDRVRHVLAQSGEDAREALELAAALGLAVDRAEWRVSCELAGLKLDPALEERLFDHALAGLDTPANSGTSPDLGSWRFAHRMLRESLERQSREAGRWPRFNSICADVLCGLYADSPPHAERRGRFLLEAGRPHEAVEALLLAAQYRSERSDLARSHRLLDQLEALLDDIKHTDLSGDAGREWLDKQRAAAFMLRSEIFSWAGRFKRALEFAESAVKMATRNKWDELIAASLYARGRAHLHLGDFNLADESLRAAREAGKLCVDPQGSAHPGLSTLGLARVAQARGEFDAAEILLRETRTLLQNAGDPQALARCYNALGDVARKTDRLDKARDFAERARALFAAGGNQAGVADCLNDLAELEHLLGDRETAEAHCLAAIDLYESIGSQRAMTVRLNLAFLWLENREFDRARRLVAGAREYFERERQLAELAHADVLLMGCAASEGDWAIWDELFDEAHHLCTTTGFKDPQIARAIELAAEVAASRDQPKRAGYARTLSRMFGPLKG